MFVTNNVQLLINGVDRTQYLDQGGANGFGWTISQQWSRQGDTATFYLWDEHNSNTEGGVVLTYTVPALAQIVFKDLGLGVTLFSGLVTNINYQRPGPNLSLWELDCTDWTYLTDHALVQLDIENLTTDQIVYAAVNQANCGITAKPVSQGGFVYPGPLVTRAKFIFTQLSSALTNIVQLAGTYTSWGWYVDENLALHFYPLVSAQNSGVTLTDQLTSTQNQATNTLGFYSDDNQSYQYITDATQIRNRAVVRGANYSVAITDTFIGNGSQSSWPLTQAPDTTAIQRIKLTVGGVTKTVSAQQGTSSTTNFVVNPNLSGQWFLQVNGSFGTIPGSSVSIVISYNYVAPNIAQSTNNSSVSTFSSLPNKGIFEVYIADTNLQSLSAAQLRGQAEVHTFAFPEQRVQLTTTEDWPGHIRAGQIFRLVNSFTPDSLNSYNVGINDTFIVIQNQIQASAYGGGYRTYSITGARAGENAGVF